MKLHKILLLSCVAVLSGCFLQKNSTTAQEKGKSIDYTQIGSPLPEVRVVAPDGTVYTNKTLDNDANLILMLFNPTCGHCEEQTEIFKQNIFLFKKTPLILVAAASMGPYMDFFEAGLKISEYPTIKYGVDSSGIVNKTFVYNGLPQINIYDKKRKLVKTFTTSVPIDSLKPYIE